MRIAWSGDIHFNYLNMKKIDKFLKSIKGSNIDYLFITGDIGEAYSCSMYLEMIAEVIKCPIFFVLGNHDFYNGSIIGVRKHITELCENSDNLCYLTNSDVQTIDYLDSSMAVIGHDGWGDCGYGDFNSSIVLTDWHVIKEFKTACNIRPIIKKRMIEFAEESVERLRVKLVKAMLTSNEIYVLTHVPVFKEASMYRGKVSNGDYLPMYCNKMLGDMLLKYAKKHPEKSIIVLSGHTHHNACYTPIPNICNVVIGSDYYKPEIKIIDC